mmetsp:Transcript_132/g.251  ORF Transcript_132/g.251 Transcript_132/m.251 type:complete len:332 (-) Transcript_132:158-1153(-)|eukprot:CAMPEP_0177734434 /NCGR_PEP_ID=MMETSP0484_2-20121128/24228_1 /TAXON_ID=354590 /ORGANISM="Rhodomonas lens, Strain RHODO" /LENGTH=331 /DNA_ID=CAMNT_0019247905 /DNA_START=120 /DNA_END=1115 /DNA_ORIENTATION=+
MTKAASQPRGHWLWASKKPEPKFSLSYEEQLLASIPEEWAGPLAVVILSFFFFSFVWFGLAKRRTSDRIVRKNHLETAPKNSHMKFDPRNGISHRSLKAELATRVVSSVHAAICCYGALSSLWWEPELSVDMLWKVSPRARFYFSVSISYFIGDVLICIVLFQDYGIEFLIHALCGLFGLSVICLGNMFHFFGCVGLSWELSTIFLNNRWFLLEYNMKKSPLMTINNFLLVPTFTVVRVVIGCPFSFLFWSQLSDARAEGVVSPWIYLGVTAMLVGLNTLNIFWSFKLWEKLIKMIRDGRRQGGGEEGGQRPAEDEAARAGEANKGGVKQE